MATKATKQTKFRWADIQDNEAEDLTYLLPPKEVIGPDKNGIKKVIEYKFNEEGKQVKSHDDDPSPKNRRRFSTQGTDIR
ncbi:hypothetical protein PVK06_023912 [Gossypium arboreum]|uniref:Uncharacterized protein n=1 Tax=Gossypium arboreum TaxID=29729 RepID=A0ABR0PCH6_GOSAR|nr:hypothetical protein PVK06_023912 [Gossypium arboreum]